MSGLVVENLRIEIAAGGASNPRVLKPVDGVSFEIGANECVALLGESGCGKSLTALALMRLLPDGGRVASGSVRLAEEDLFALTEAEMGEVRGGRLAMIFQEPQTSLNPVMTVAEQIDEALMAHRGLTGAAATEESLRLLESVGLGADKLDAYPFQLSGGQRQRALIAMMLAGEPEVLIADEPTTALDVTVQAQILRLLKDLQQQRGMSLLLITHDLDVAHDMADRVAVMYAGQIVEWASSDALYAAPRHPYTQKLFAVLPRLDRRGERLDSLPGRVPGPDTLFVGCRFADRCPVAFERCRVETPAFHEAAPGHFARCHLADSADESTSRRVRHAHQITPNGAHGAPYAAPLAVVLEVRDLAVHFPIRKGLLKRTIGHAKAVDGVSLQVAAGETLALVGESGCGKTTLARAILRLIEPTAGRVSLLGEPLAGLRGEALRRKRAEMQIVFQDPFSSLNPRMKVGEILAEGMAALLSLSAAAQRERVADLLNQVGLPADAVGRYPHEFSGGQRQRIAIARALAVEPKLLILDEPTSALDVSVQAQILNLLADLQQQHGLAYLFITHNLSVVSYLAHRVAVMQGGKIVEQGEAETLLTRPENAYTRLLLDSAPGRGVGS
ncbi:MAG: ABC transporter ATP-binding protein [Pseudomonadota bacterium]|nr:ABC transporter ATP-binding protein [Pseudomonadota bacterium]